MFWAIGLVIVGTLVMRVSGEGPRNGTPISVIYGFDMLLPIIRLRDKHYEIDLQSWANYYFYWRQRLRFYQVVARA